MSESGDQKGRVVLVTGSVGCGKTTLVNKVLVEAHQDKILKAIVIDLIDEAINQNVNVSQQLWKYVEQEWRRTQGFSFQYEELCKIFGHELADLRRGPRENFFNHHEKEYLEYEAKLLEELVNTPEMFFPRCWRYFRGKGIGTVIFFDNVDRASQTYQEQVYSFAHKLARQTGATVIVTMREFTFFRGREAGFLDVRSSDTIFHLQTPNIVQVLSKRIKYIESHLEDDHRISKWRRRHDWQAFRNILLTHTDIIKRTFLVTKEGDNRLSLLEALSWHNVRLFLSTLRQLHLMLGDSYQPWQFSEMIAALMTPVSSGTSKPVIGNIYRPSYPNFQCYFLKIRILILLAYGQPEYRTRRGTSLNRILSFMSLYGYHESWTKRAIIELVQERFLECLEGPSEEDYTKRYEISKAHSYRPSPLAMVVIDQVISKPIYLCLIGNDLPFHNPATIDSYEAALREVYEALGTQALEREVIELIPEVGLSKIVARYISSMFLKEQPPENLLNYVPEIGATENKLNELIRKVQEFADVSLPTSQKTSQVTQLALFSSDAEMVNLKLTDLIPIPDNINDIRIGHSEYGPLIFWALVALNKSGHYFAIGTEITDVINEYLVDEQNKKAPNNVSRALRSDALQSQPWLLTKKIKPRKKIFSLSENWETSWIEVFGIPAPDM